MLISIVSIVTGVICVNCHHIEGNIIFDSSRTTTGAPEQENVVETKYGQVQGFVKDGILQFLDIPYGKFGKETPFQEPEEPISWRPKTRGETEHMSRCPQMEDTFVGNDDCLTLSIFKANKAIGDDNSAKLADVLFHIHDSSFSSGSGDPSIYGPKYLVEHEIILVLPNYRLGALGFMCLHNSTAPGNAALKDLTLALKWTAENIQNFDGNPSNIVVSGAGAGGALAEFLLISNISSPYISRGITESGFSLSPWALDRNPIETASTLQPIIQQGQIDLEQLVMQSVNIKFRPCIEREAGFITESPWQLLGINHTQLSYMTGTANHAAWAKAVRQTKTEENIAELNDDLSILLPTDLVFENNEEKLRISTQVKAIYFGERNNITMTDVNQLSQLFTDSGYLNPGLRGARLLVEGGANVYFYEYSFNNPDLKQAFNASTRGDSLAFVFSKNGSTDEETYENRRMRIIMTSLWVNFIKAGEPSAESITWRNLSQGAPAEEEWLSIGHELRMRRGLHHNRLRIWQDIYDKHFIENNLGFVHKPSFYILASCLSTLVRFGMKS